MTTEELSIEKLEREAEEFVRYLEQHALDAPDDVRIPASLRRLIAALKAENARLVQERALEMIEETNLYEEAAKKIEELRADREKWKLEAELQRDRCLKVAERSTERAIEFAALKAKIDAAPKVWIWWKGYPSGGQQYIERFTEDSDEMETWEPGPHDRIEQVYAVPCSDKEGK